MNSWSCPRPCNRLSMSQFIIIVLVCFYSFKIPTMSHSKPQPIPRLAHITRFVFPNKIYGILSTVIYDGNRPVFRIFYDFPFFSPSRWHCSKSTDPFETILSSNQRYIPHVEISLCFFIWC